MARDVEELLDGDHENDARVHEDKPVRVGPSEAVGRRTKEVLDEEEDGAGQYTGPYTGPYTVRIRVRITSMRKKMAERRTMTV